MEGCRSIRNYEFLNLNWHYFANTKTTKTQALSTLPILQININKWPILSTSITIVYLTTFRAGYHMLCICWIALGLDLTLPLDHGRTNIDFVSVH